MEDKVRTLLCEKCGYIWEYKGDLLRATCPCCNAKVNTLLCDITED